MATTAGITLDEYLRTSYRPDQDFVNGQLAARNLGEFDHSNLQGTLIGWLFQRQREWNIRALPEQRIRVSATRFRIPDVCVLSRAQPVEPVLSQPPLVCIEILSKDDTLRSLRERIDDCRAFGVSHIWVLDPVARCAYRFVEDRFEQAGAVLEVPQSPIRIPLDELFAHLD